MSKVSLQEHLALCAQRIKVFTNQQLLDFTQATLDALKEMAEAKADKSALTEGLAQKADKEATEQAIAKKANADDVKAALAFFSAAGLYVDTDGDIAQKD